MDWQALVLTLRLATITTLILMLIAIPLGYWLAYGASRVRPLIEAAVALPLILPPTVLGFYLLVLLGPRTFVGRALVALLGHSLVFSFSGLVVGSVLYSLPFAVQPIAAGFAGVDPEVYEAAILLSPRRSRIVSRILLPLVKPSLVTGAVLAFAHTVGEFGVVLMIGGSIPGTTKTLSISIYDQVENFDYASATRTSLLLLAIAFLALTVVYLRKKAGGAGSIDTGLNKGGGANA